MKRINKVLQYKEMGPDNEKEFDINYKRISGAIK